MSADDGLNLGWEQGGGDQAWATVGLSGALYSIFGIPKTFFHYRVRRDPIAPIPMLLYGYSFEIWACSVAFAVMAFTFASTTTLETRISLTTLAGYDCTVLNPTKSTVYYSSVHSENAQFASPYMKQAECESYLRELKVCEDDVRVDHLSVFGVTNPTNMKYYSTGYLTFSPTQTSGLSTQLTCIYGCSVSFPLPPFGQKFPGSETNWYLFHFARGTSNASVEPFPSVVASSFLHDPETNRVYDPAPIATPRDYDLSTSASYATTATNVIGSIKTTQPLDSNILVDIGVFNGVYFGYKIGQTFSRPTSVETLSEPSTDGVLSYVYVTEYSGHVIQVDSGGTLSKSTELAGNFNQANGIALPPEAFVTGYTGISPGTESVELRITATSSGRLIDGMVLQGNGAGSATTLSGCNINSSGVGTCTLSSPQTIPLGTPLRGNSEVIYLACGSTVYKMAGGIGVTIAGGGVTKLGNANAYNVAGAVALDGNGNVFVAETDGDKVTKVVFGAVVMGYSGTDSTSTTSSTTLTITSTVSGDIADGMVISIAGTGVDGPVTLSGCSIVAGVGTCIMSHPSSISVGDSGGVGVAITAVTISSAFAATGMSKPNGVAADVLGNLYVTYLNTNLIHRIDTTGDVTSVGTQALPKFNSPRGIALDKTGAYLYVADKGNNLVRKVTLATGLVTNLGTQALPAFSSPYDVAVDAFDNVYVADFSNDLVRKIDASTGELTTRVGRLTPPLVFSYDTKAGGSYSEWPNTAFQGGDLTNLQPIDTPSGGCQNVESFKLAPGTSPPEYLCFLQVHAEHSDESGGYIYIEFAQFQYVLPRISQTYSRVLILDPVAKAAVGRQVLLPPPPTTSSSRQLWAVIKPPDFNGGVPVLYTSSGAYSSVRPVIPDRAPSVTVNIPQYNALVTAAGTLIISASKIPTTGTSRYLLMYLLRKGVYTMVTYDSYNDVHFSNAAAAATTNYMLSYTYGFCDGAVTRSLVEVTFSNTYNNQCKLPSRGLYYQSENRHYTIPYSCLTIPHERLLTDCPEVARNMKRLISDTCQASIAKVCKSQYADNPPFACLRNNATPPLTVISLAGSNTMAIASFLATLVAAILTRMYRKYVPTANELRITNPPETLGLVPIRNDLDKASYGLEQRIELLEKQLAAVLGEAASPTSWRNAKIHIEA